MLTTLLPCGSYDTHVHVFDALRFPYAAHRSYSPATAKLDQLQRFTASLTEDGKPQNFVLVQPSPYGTDNAALLDALQQLGGAGGRSRGIAVIDPKSITDAELWKLHHYGVRGVRINTEASGKASDSKDICSLIKAAEQRIKHLPGWAIQIFVPATLWSAEYTFFKSLSVPVVGDHFGGLKGVSRLPRSSPLPPFSDALNQPGLTELLDLAVSGHVYIKLSGCYRASTLDASGYDDLEPLVRKLVDTCPNQLVYASDWPHTGDGKDRVGRSVEEVEPFRIIDQRLVVERMREWVGEEDTWRTILVDNPRKLYGIK
ncbi:transcriptional family amidohydrolase family protein [Pseudohyphozyma bogoriensis]|nr:transcriptional family amidohydrolase family protein [Pseudohyphozyma bogoriensis]